MSLMPHFKTTTVFPKASFQRHAAFTMQWSRDRQRRFSRIARHAVMPCLKPYNTQSALPGAICPVPVLTHGTGIGFPRTCGCLSILGFMLCRIRIPGNVYVITSWGLMLYVHALAGWNAILMNVTSAYAQKKCIFPWQMHVIMSLSYLLLAASLFVHVLQVCLGPQTLHHCNTGGNVCDVPGGSSQPGVTGVSLIIQVCYCFDKTSACIVVCMPLCFL